MKSKRGPHNPTLKWLIFAVAFLQIAILQSNLGGVLEANSLLNRSNNLRSAPENRIRGTIPCSTVKCKRLMYLNLSNNLLKNIGMVSRALMRLNFAGKLDNLSKNHYKSAIISSSRKLTRDSKSNVVDREDSTDQGDASSTQSQQSGSKSHKGWSLTWILIVVGTLIMLWIVYLGGKKVARLAQESESTSPTPREGSPYCKTPLAPKALEEEAEPEARESDQLVFFVEERERFTLEDLLEATADLRSHGVCSTLYKVGLKTDMVYAVKRLKNLWVSFEDFAKAMRQIGNVKHRNILPLVAYSSTPEDKLLIYKYQNNGSLLNLLEDYIEGKREFQWGLRLSIARGIARGLSFIYDNSNNNNNDDKEIISHGNIKLSNILLDESDHEPLIGEFGYSKFLDPNGLGLCSTKGYAAPERRLTEKSDVYSFGVVLLELLTGRVVEKTGLDLPKWVNAMVREEWTGEVFDKNLAKTATQWAFPMLNVALKCVSYSPEDRPTFAEVLERIEDVGYAEEDHGMSPLSPTSECHKDCCVLHSIIPEAWDTPGSNY